MANVNHVISENLSKVGGWNIIINDQEIDDRVFDDELVDWTWRDRIELIKDIMEWHCEARNAGQKKDEFLMFDDIKYLMSLEDNHVFSSQLTNDYIAYSDDEVKFHEICEEILAANAKLIAGEIE